MTDQGPQRRAILQHLAGSQVIVRMQMRSSLTSLQLRPSSSQLCSELQLPTRGPSRHTTHPGSIRLQPGASATLCTETLCKFVLGPHCPGLLQVCEIRQAGRSSARFLLSARACSHAAWMMQPAGLCSLI